jgi:hypothetical protein
MRWRTRAYNAGEPTIVPLSPELRARLDVGRDLKVRAIRTRTSARRESHRAGRTDLSGDPRPDPCDGRPSFEPRETRAIAALNHPHVCTLHDIGPDYLGGAAAGAFHSFFWIGVQAGILGNRRFRLSYTTSPSWTAEVWQRNRHFRRIRRDFTRNYPPLPFV